MKFQDRVNTADADAVYSFLHEKDALKTSFRQGKGEDTTQRFSTDTASTFAVSKRIEVDVMKAVAKNVQLHRAKNELTRSTLTFAEHKTLT